MISIIIPTLNECHFLKGTIEDLLKKSRDPDQLEIIVVDSGSTDGTLESIKSLKVYSFLEPSFKLKKCASLNYGIEKAKGDFLLFLDADTTLPKEFDLLIQEKLKNPSIVGGAFEFAFGNPDWKLKLIQFVNRIRYRFSNIYYGDQAVFCSRKVALEVGGYPEKRLMEAAFFCQKLMKVGKLSLIKSPIKTSARRFLDHGFFRICWFDFIMWFRFVLNFSVDEYGEKYWSKNLKSNG